MSATAELAARAGTHLVAHGELVWLALIWLQLREMNRRAQGKRPIGEADAVIYAVVGLYVVFAAFLVLREAVLSLVTEAFRWTT